METELFASVEAGDLDKFKELIKKETKETIDQVNMPVWSLVKILNLIILI